MRGHAFCAALNLSAAELGYVPYRSSRVRQRAGRQFERHEYVVRDVELAAQSELAGGTESETRVELRVADDNDGVISEAGALAEAGADQRRADALPLQARHDRHRAKAEHARRRACRIEIDRREQDVPDNRRVSNSDERNRGMPGSTCCVDDAGFVGAAEGEVVDAADARFVTRLFVSYFHRNRANVEPA
jgi:hypothetical protein